ncbi:hypothetical protein [Chondromyces crocatus]|uniref:EF-hand domain-containing protein n=1 Tax=Chondromyces crocatus TaxID=52 RepID=A0A0K1EE15_CHOCO|nr:hypothetical protein [Chondromyces crocatus]AKT39106.1 uncharacterized protein CMC5_032530 [Chondromyces crocatus]
MSERLRAPQRSRTTFFFALCGMAAIGLVPVSCVLDTEGTLSQPTGGIGGQGGQTNPGTEDCLDGIDNDGDGLIDCADVEDCAPASYECAPAVPAGWTGNVRVAIVDFAAADTLPACPEGTETSDYFAGPATEAACSNCDGCTWNRDDAECYAPTLSCYSSNSSNTNCSGAPTSARPNYRGNVCESFITGVPNSVSCRITSGASLRRRGECTAAPDGGQLQNAPWAQAIRVCTGAPREGGHCDDGRQCLPKTNDDPAFGGLACVLTPGDEACPAGWTDLEQQIFQSGDDTRTCAACGCDLGALGCDGGGFRAHDFSNCNGSSITIDSNQCVDITPVLGQSFSFRAMAATVTGDVACTGGQGSGAVTPTGPAKLCCRSTGGN